VLIGRDGDRGRYGGVHGTGPSTSREQLKRFEG
jgi:hypothetical protein